MLIPPDILSILVCPESKRTLLEASEAQIKAINARILSGSIINRANTPVTEPITAGLIETESNILYPIRGGIPVLIASEGIVLA